MNNFTELHLITAIKGLQDALFISFLQKAALLPTGCEFTLPNLFGTEYWNSISIGNKISASKVIKSNVVLGNVTGIERVESAIPTYRKTGVVSAPDVFISNYLGEVDFTNSRTIDALSINLSEYGSTAVVYCCYEVTDKGLLLKTRTGIYNGLSETTEISKGLIPSEKFVSSEFTIKNNFFDANRINNRDQKEYKAILSAWFGFETAANLSIDTWDVEKIIIIVPNTQMAIRVCGINTTNMSYVDGKQNNYTLFIQKHFSNFTPTSTKHINKPTGVVSMTNTELKKLFKIIDSEK